MHSQADSRRRRLLRPSIADALYWRSCLPPKFGNGYSAAVLRYPCHLHFFNTLSAYFSRSSVALGLKENGFPEIVSPHHASPIASLDLDLIESRFLLAAGARDCTISVFDLGVAGSDGHTHAFRPVAQSHKAARGTDAEQHLAHIPRGHSYSPTAVQWYTKDTGAFISTDSAGNLLVWDTNSFTPVYITNIVATGDSQVAIQAMALTQHTGQTVSHSLAALGCRSTSNTSAFDDSVIRLLDIKTGSVVQQLSGHARGGVGTIQWLPLHDFILASGGDDAAIRFWDIRKSGRGALLQTLDRSQSHEQTDHIRKGIQNHELYTCSNHSLQHGLHRAQSHGGPISSIAFTPDGSYLLSASTADRQLQLWDIRPGTSHGSVLLPTSFLGITDDQQFCPLALHKDQMRVSLLVTQPGSMRTTATVWVSGYPTGEIIGYNIHAQGFPEKVLQGHVYPVQCMTQQQSCMRIFSGDSSGMILGWGHFYKG